MEKVECQDCAFVEEQKGSNFVCHLNPPVAVSVLQCDNYGSQRLVMEFWCPTVYVGDWCAQGRRKKK